MANSEFQGEVVPLALFVPLDAFVFIDAIPRTSVGKFKKMALREQFADWKWES